MYNVKRNYNSINDVFIKGHTHSKKNKTKRQKQFTECSLVTEFPSLLPKIRVVIVVSRVTERFLH